MGSPVSTMEIITPILVFSPVITMEIITPILVFSLATSCSGGTISQPSPGVRVIKSGEEKMVVCQGSSLANNQCDGSDRCLISCSDGSQQSVDCKGKGSSIYTSPGGTVTVECGVSVEFSSCFPFCGGFGNYEDYDYYGGGGSVEGSGDQDYDNFSGTTSQTCVGTTCILNLHHTSLPPGGGGGGGDVRVIHCRGSPRSSFCDGSLCRVSCWDGSEVTFIPIIPLSFVVLLRRLSTARTEERPP